MTKVRDGRMVLDQDVTSGLLRMIDAIRQIASHIEQHETEPEGEPPARHVVGHGLVADRTPDLFVDRVELAAG